MVLYNFMDFAIPFFLVLAIAYGALEMGAPFKNKGAKMIIALILAFFTASQYEFVTFIFAVLPYAVVLFVVVFLIGFIKKSFPKVGGKGGINTGLLLVIITLIIIFLANQGTDLINDWLPYGFVTSENLVLILGIALIIGILYLVSKNWRSE